MFALSAAEREAKSVTEQDELSSDDPSSDMDEFGDIDEPPVQRDGYEAEFQNPGHLIAAE